MRKIDRSDRAFRLAYIVGLAQDGDRCHRCTVRARRVIRHDIPANLRTAFYDFARGIIDRGRRVVDHGDGQHIGVAVTLGIDNFQLK